MNFPFHRQFAKIFFRENSAHATNPHVMVLQRRRRHFKSGQATSNKRSLVHMQGGGSTIDNVRQ